MFKVQQAFEVEKYPTPILLHNLVLSRFESFEELLKLVV
jgi:hypothetical protein